MKNIVYTIKGIVDFINNSSKTLSLGILLIISVSSFSQVIDCTSAQQIMLNVTTPAFTTQSGVSGLPLLTGCTTGKSYAESWFTFKAVSEYSVLNFINTGNKPGFVYIYSGSCETLNYITCRITSPGVASTISSNTSGSGALIFPTAADVNYYIRIVRADSLGIVGGTLTVNPAIRCSVDHSSYSTGSADDNGIKYDDIMTVGYISGPYDEVCGYAKFNISNLSSANINNVTGMYFVATCKDNNITSISNYWSGIVKMKYPVLDPVAAKGSEIFYQNGSTNIYSGTKANISSYQFKANTTYSFALNSQALTDMKNNLSLKWWALNFQVTESSLWGYGDVRMHWYGYNDINPPYLILTLGSTCKPPVFTTQPAATQQGCYPANASYHAEAVGDEPVVYQWQMYVNGTWKDFDDGGTAPMLSGSRTSALVVSGATKTTIFRCTASNCSGTLAVSNSCTLNVFPQTKVSLGNDAFITTSDKLVLDAGKDMTNYIWNDGSANQTLTVDGTQTSKGTFVYSVTVTDKNGCNASDDIKVTVIEPTDIITLKLDNISTCNSDTLSVPLSVLNFNNVGSFGIKIKFDTLALKYTGIRNLNPKLTDMVSYIKKGILGFAWVSADNQPLDLGNTTLFEIQFVYKTGSTDLTFQSDCEIVNNNTLENFQLNLINAKVTGGNASGISGKVTYDNAAATPLSNVRVMLYNRDNVLLYTTSTDASGHYTFNNINCGTYTLKAETQRTAGGLTPLDALLINKYFISSYMFSDELKLQSADVNNDKKYTPTDALYILKRYIGAISSFPSGDWLFESKPVQLSGNNLTYDIKGICYGDVNGSYSPPAKKIMKKNIFLQDDTENLQINNSSIIEIPVRVNRDVSLGSFGIKFKAGNNSIKILDIESDIEGLIYNISDENAGNEVAVGWASMNDRALILNAGDIMFKVKVKFTGALTDNITDMFIAGAEPEFSDSNAKIIDRNMLTEPGIISVKPGNTTGLLQNYPNPFYSYTKIDYSIPEEGMVTLKVTNLLGVELKVLVKAVQQGGNYTYEFNNEALASGLYLYTLSFESVNKKYNATKMMMIK